MSVPAEVDALSGEVGDAADFGGGVAVGERGSDRGAVLEDRGGVGAAGLLPGGGCDLYAA